MNNIFDGIGIDVDVDSINGIQENLAELLREMRKDSYIQTRQRWMMMGWVTGKVADAIFETEEQKEGFYTTVMEEKITED